MRIQTLNAAALIALTALASCSSDDDGGGGVKVPDHGYMLGFRTSTDPTADYILFKDDLSSGSISATGNGVEQEGWGYYVKSGNTYLAFDYTNSIAKGYRIEDGHFNNVGQFAFERADLFGEGTNNTLIAVGAPWGGGSYDCKIMLIDPQDVAISKTVATPIYKSFNKEGKQLNAWPTAAWVQNSKLYLPFYPTDMPDWITPLTDTAYVAVYSYPELKYETTFKDTRTGPIGYYSSQPCVLQDEQGNHYTLSSSSIAAGYTQSTKPSGILKINKDQTAFDKDYFFNTEALGYRVMAGTYVGNGKVVARVIAVAVDNNEAVKPWAAFSVMAAPLHNIAVLDLNAKTLKIVEQIPMHGGQYLTPFLVENGKVWASITTTASDAFVYQIDPATATATKGARIEGSEIQGFYKF